MSLIWFIDVSKRFAQKGAEQAALENINIEIRRGEIFGVIGPSGSGKSTLIRLINRLERPSKGRIETGGIDLAHLDARALSARRHKLGMIFQQFGLLSSKTARQNVLFALELAREGTNTSRRAKVDALLERVGLQEHANKYPAQLSGGQKQRVGIARALANDPEILLSDEATSALDPEATLEVLKLLTELNRELGLTIVLVTHEMDVVRRVCDRVAILDQGRLAEVGDVAQVLFDPQSPQAKTLSRHILSHPERAGLADDTRRRLTYFNDVVGSDALSAATQGLNVSFSILAGQVSELKSGPYGHLIVDITGPDREQAILRLKARKVSVRELDA